MFTGLVETTGSIRSIEPAQEAVLLHVIPQKRPFEVGVGDSVAVNGVCLTVESFQRDSVRFTAVKETLDRSTLGKLRSGHMVNLERALRPMDRMGGHFVAGHVDGIGSILRDAKVGAAVVRTIQVPGDLGKFMAEKGSVTLDGVSLTIARSTGSTIDVSLVPHTLGATNILSKRAGDQINIECDILARYIFHLLKYGKESTDQFMSENPKSSSDSGLLGKLEAFGY